MYPALRNVPMAVGGHEETRHGIILTKNDMCKKYHIKTAETLREAREKCPDLLIIPPHYDEYIYYTNEVKNIYREYSDHVESFGLDEAWIDITDSIPLFGSKEYIATTIQRRVLEELGLTISIGVSFNKIFAKLGSDMIKPSGLVYITRENFKRVVWPLDVADLLYVGPATERKLKAYGIETIGELANAPTAFLKAKLGKMGLVVQSFANGLDESEVCVQGFTTDPKSIGNSITTVRDVYTYDECIQVYYVLCECVASRMRDANMKGSVVSIGVRNKELEGFSRQYTCDNPVSTSEDLMKIVKLLVRNSVDFKIPLRSIGVSVSHLKIDDGISQINLFEDEDVKRRNQIIDMTVDKLRDKYGFDAIKRASLLLYEDLTSFNPKADNTVHPVGYFNGTL